MARRFSQVLRKKESEGEEGRKLTVRLDQDSAGRLDRLRGILKKLNDDTLIAFALRSLENRVERIVKRRVLKNIRALKKKGFNSRQIADYLNQKGVPPLGPLNKWDDRTISNFLG